ncbi:MAG: hypothetical protein U0270_44505 [Labilithrix sp.]
MPGAFESGGSRALLELRDLAFAHHGPIGEAEIGRWARASGGVERDSAAYAAARISTPGFMWANCNAWGLKVGEIGELLGKAPRVGDADLENVWRRCRRD